MLRNILRRSRDLYYFLMQIDIQELSKLATCFIRCWGKVCEIMLEFHLNSKRNLQTVNELTDDESNCFKQLTIVVKLSILDICGVSWGCFISYNVFLLHIFRAKICNDQFYLVMLVLIRSLLLRFLSLKLIQNLTGNCSWKLIFVSRIGKCRTGNYDSFWPLKSIPVSKLGGLFYIESHCVKSVHIWSFSGPYFSAFGLRTGMEL